jgi:DNA-binding beta-propeller fold protein YncE
MTIMTFSKNTISALLATVILSVFACTKGDDKPETGYTSGVFISCEGAFTGGTGTVSYYNRVDSTKGDIYGAANNGAKIGNILQSYTAFIDAGYLVVNNANKMITVDPKTFVATATYDTGFIYPRYAIGADAKRLYVSSWGKDGEKGNVRLFDLESKKVSRIVPTGKGTSKMIFIGGKIWAVNDGGFGMDSTVVIINTVNNADTIVEKRIKVGAAPKDIIADNNGNVWVLCGGYDFSVAQDKKTSRLIQIRNETVVASFDNLPSSASSLVLDNARTTLYFIAGNKIYSKDPLSFNSVAPTVFLENTAFKSLYSLGVDPKTGYLYVGDAIDFTNNGQVFVYDLATKSSKGVLKTGVGIAPNGFYFN